MVVAGGTDLGVESNLRGSRWPHLVSVEAIAELREFSNTSERVMLGAALPLNEISRLWTDAPDAFRTWLGLFASPLIRNRATLGGNLATASPIGDAAPLLLALDAVVHVAGRSGRRAVPLASFFIGYRRTALQPGEILVGVEIPKPLPDFIHFYKIAKRRLDDISTVAAAIAIDLDGHGRVNRSRFAFGGVAATPIRVTEAEDALVNRAWDGVAVERIQQILDRTLTPLSDHRGSKEYRLEVCKSLIEKCRWEQRA
jgi:xanthine dehydrogenase small subunit